MGQASYRATRSGKPRSRVGHAPPGPTAWVTPTWQAGAKVAWQGRIGMFLREAEDDQVELLIGSRTYRVRRAEVRSA
jgi:hypothetical protein